MSSLLATAGMDEHRMDMLFCAWNPLYSTLTVKAVDLSGKNAIVTGANVGIGLETARKLAQFGAHVTLACRDAQKGETARQDIMATTDSKSVEVLVLDCSSFSSVRAFATAWGDKPLDILVNNAGITAARYTVNDGFESTYMTNILSHFLLTLLLLPSMVAGGRIVNVSSAAHYSAKRHHLDVNDLDSSKYLTGECQLQVDGLLGGRAAELYSKSKLAQVVFARELQIRLDASTVYASRRITATSLHPGLVQSSIWERHRGVTSEAAKRIDRVVGIVNRLGITSEQGACTPVYLAVSADPIKGGMYYDRQQWRSNNVLAEDAALRAEMWAAWLVACAAPDLQ